MEPTKIMAEETDAAYMLEIYSQKAAKILGITDESLITHGCIMAALEQQELIERTVETHSRDLEKFEKENRELRTQCRYLTALLASRYRTATASTPSEVK